VRAFTHQAVLSSVDIFRVFDSLKHMDNLKFVRHEIMYQNFDFIVLFVGAKWILFVVV
jgi:pyruvate carboxylase